MANKKSNLKKENKPQSDLSQPWISMRAGLIIITITSLVMAGLTAWQVIPERGWLEGSLWGLLFGGLIWGIFFGNILINKLLRRGR
ncbi:MAG: hypothetical protein Fur0016_18400 [Anaerolineales bacterium]